MLASTNENWVDDITKQKSKVLKTYDLLVDMMHPE